MVALRAVRVADAGVLGALAAAAFDPEYGEGWTATHIAGALSGPGAIGQVAWRAAAPVGFTLLRAAADEAELLLVAVTPESRGEGLGARLIGQSLAQARGAGVARIFLEVRESNQAARGLYEGQGFVTVGRRAAYYLGRDGVRRDAITMRRCLLG